MVRFEEITSKDIRVPYTKDDIEGIIVKGSVAYDKEENVTSASGSINDVEGGYIADFSSYGVGENVRINLANCIPAKLGEASMVAQATIADLNNQYPEE